MAILMNAYLALIQITAFLSAVKRKIAPQWKFTIFTEAKSL